MPQTATDCLDYTELFSYNFSSAPLPSDEPREPLDTGEAIRLIIMNLKATKLEQPGPTDGQTLPIVHFTGTSRSMHASWDPNSNSTIRGKYLCLKSPWTPLLTWLNAVQQAQSD